MDYSDWRQFGIMGPLRHVRIADMQNDLALTREILEQVTARSDMLPRPVQVDGYDAVLVARHVARLQDDGMLEGVRHHAVKEQAPLVKVTDLTTAGHQLLAAMQSKDIWPRMKEALSPEALASLSFGEIGKIASDLAGRIARRKLGLD